MTKKNVVIGFLGTRLDAAGRDSSERWERWRPSVAMFGHDILRVDRLELLVSSEEHLALADEVRQDVQSIRPDAQVLVHLVPMPDPWNFQEVYAGLHDFAKGYAFKDDCNYFVHLTTGTHVAQICLFLLTEARYFPAQLLETYSHKAAQGEPWRGSVEVIDLNLSSYDQLAKRFHRESQESQSVLKGGIVTRNAAFNELIERIEQVALRSSAPMLLTGPTGAGKSLLACRIHALRSRRHLVAGPFVEINCATLRGDNAMSALFGHKKGAFTGAAEARAGLLKSADGGILFLDEIGTLGLDEQAMLLRALETKKFLPLGSDKEVSSDFQLLAGTNLDLEEQARQGRFREDLLARINLWHFELPGLAQRPEDIEPNLDYELERASRELGTRVTMTTEAREAYLACALKAPWPGNFRDLAASVTRMATLCEAGRIGVGEVKLECPRLLKQAKAAPKSAAQGLAARVLAGDKLQELDAFDVLQLDAVLSVVSRSDSLADAGRALFSVSLASRPNPNNSDRVRKYLAQYGLTFKDIKAALA